MSNKQELDKVTDAKTDGHMAIFLKYLPLVLSVIAIVITGIGEYRRSVEAKSTYNQGRIELFRQMTQHGVSGDQIKQIYKEIFPRDSKILQDEQNAMAGQ